jgi:hypothetical protein
MVGYVVKHIRTAPRSRTPHQKNSRTFLYLEIIALNSDYILIHYPRDIGREGKYHQLLEISDEYFSVLINSWYAEVQCRTLVLSAADISIDSQLVLCHWC